MPAASRYDRQKVGSRIRAVRLNKELTQAALAAEAGTSRENVNQIEAGKRPVGPDVLGRIAEALGVSPVELGADELVPEPEFRPLLVRLEALEADLEKLRDDRVRALRAVTRRLAEIEAALELLAQPKSHPRSGGK